MTLSETGLRSPPWKGQRSTTSARADLRKEANMHPLDGLARMTEFAGNNLAYNLQFIPADKLGWKPAPGAKSALEIVQHVTGALNSLRPILTGGAYSGGEIPLPTDCKSAQELVRNAV